jgi:hypothetical protein
MLTGSLPYFQGNWTEMYQKRVSGGVLQFPRGVPPLAMEMCARLLDRDPKTRIGSNGGAEEVRQHPWVAGVDWEQVYTKQITPPINPKENPDNFDPMFTKKELPAQMSDMGRPASSTDGGNQLPHWSFSEAINGSNIDK